MDASEYRCPVDWPATRQGLCRPHRCELPEGHTGPHVCTCGAQRRNMKRDQLVEDEA